MPPSNRITINGYPPLPEGAPKLQNEGVLEQKLVESPDDEDEEVLLDVLDVLEELEDEDDALPGLIPSAPQAVKIEAIINTNRFCMVINHSLDCYK